MKTRLFTAAIAVSLVAAYAQSSTAATVSISNESFSPFNFAGAGFDTTASSSTGFFTQTTAGSIGGVQRSPFANPLTNYSAISNNAVFTAGSATYNYAAGLTSFSFLWGSPDQYNTVKFFSGQGGTGSVEGTFTGSSLTDPFKHIGYDLVTFLATGGTIGSVVLSDSGQPAFEYSNVTATPLPAALPLFASALGIGGFFAAWRKKKAAKSQVAVA
jgi:hypothetical protein